MKTHLLYPDRDFDATYEPPANADSLIADLGLEAIFTAMAQDDDTLLDVARRVILHSESDPTVIVHRQDVLRDLVRNPKFAHDLYNIAGEAILGEKRNVHGMFFGKNPDLTLSRSIEVLKMFVDALKRLRRLAVQHQHHFDAHGLRILCTELVEELTESYFAEIEEHLNTLQFSNGVVISAQIGQGGKGRDHVLRQPPKAEAARWLNWLTGTEKKTGLSFRIADRDDAGANALAELRGRGIDLVANALAQSTDHILNYFTTLRWELAFYIGCLNLHTDLAAKTRDVCYPAPAPIGTTQLSFTDLRDTVLSLRLIERPVVGNDLNADDKQLIMITGANQGGKSTFLRSLGQAHLMMQCGLFVTARSFSASVSSGIYTHYTREEDAAMDSGKFDEELKRMSEIVDHVLPGGLVMFNESFASTSEREGSEIARNIIRALVAGDIRVVFVTHLYELARTLHQEANFNAAFLRAERSPDGTRTYRVVDGKPLATSYGPDLYSRIFGTASTR